MRHIEEQIKFTVRVPKTIYQKLKEVTATSKRSMTGEIVYILQQEFAKNQQIKHTQDNMASIKDVHDIVRKELERLNSYQLKAGQ